MCLSSLRRASRGTERFSYFIKKQVPFLQKNLQWTIEDVLLNRMRDESKPVKVNIILKMTTFITKYVL